MYSSYERWSELQRNQDEDDEEEEDEDAISDRRT
jgi:hypothetical protein